MTSVHFYVAKSQPATRYLVDLFDDCEPMVFEQPPRSLVRCVNCLRRRWAERCSVQVYYDSIRFFCTDKARCIPKRRRSKKP